MRILVLLATAALLLSGCDAEAEPEEVLISEETWVMDALPYGDPQRGRERFIQLRCSDCHRVQGDEALPPLRDYIDADLGPELRPIPAEELAMSIISRAHLPRADRPFQADPPPMGTLGRRMTVEDLVDVVAYLRNQQTEDP